MKSVVNILVCLLLCGFCTAQPKEYYVLFEYDKSIVPDTAMAYLIKTIYSNNIQHIYLEGHCDSIGSRGYNYALSERRVKAVEELLVQNGFERKKISGKVGFGKDKPLTSNSSAEARQKNRRVLVRFGGITPIPKKSKPVITKSKLNPEMTESSAHTVRVKKTKAPPKELGIPVGRNSYKTDKKKKAQSPAPVVQPKKLKRENFIKGATIALPNLNFQGGRHYLLSRSTATLDTLLDILQENPKLTIEIQGHVCCTTFEPDGYDVDLGTPNLSETRAQAIKAFLVKKGISSTRIATKGFGGSRKLYPDEENAFQREHNRRVEVKIISD